MYRSVRCYIIHCRECQRGKSVPKKPPGLLIPIPPASVPFQRVGIDLLGRFPRSTKGNKWIIVCTDYLSRFTVTKALPTAEAEEVAKFITEEIVLKHGAPRTILTDRGKVFESKLVTELGQLCSSKHRKMTGYYPQTNGLT
ncbi:transposon Ty3-I Gag-Pol polyprotein [Trichonephila inaurata madagascariensis]|uniref:Transposon Ty3-I Gag-Pol polyprotein n=1 Tax=Trichonephila inaurata madagascariensis TaxID=2747483 RepID=A0A8X6YLI3_9ARAC|nr:transposon Ty3-I Gag-Pol polyprotein [Trichonephila inaurata madagascariensis]